MASTIINLDATQNLIIAFIFVLTQQNAFPFRLFKPLLSLRKGRFKTPLGSSRTDGFHNLWTDPDLSVQETTLSSNDAATPRAATPPPPLHLIQNLNPSCKEL
jgi:hypothetical protein